MKPGIRVGLVAAAVLVSGVAIACDDMTMTGNDDGYAAAKAPAAPVVATEKAAPITTTKTKTPVKQKTAGKPLPSGTTIARTSN